MFKKAREFYAQHQEHDKMTTDGIGQFCEYRLLFAAFRCQTGLPSLPGL